MNGKLFFSFFISIFLVTATSADNTLFIIKVNGAYGIISKGTNQGIKEGDILHVRREGTQQSICKVKVIRTTPNRSAIEQISEKNTVILLKEDRLFFERELAHFMAQTAAPSQETARPAGQPEVTYTTTQREKRTSAKIEKTTSLPEPAYEQESSSNRTVSQAGSSSFRSYSPMRHFKNPWVTFEIGSIFPNGHFSELYSNSLQVNANYMVSITDDVNIGLDISNAFLNNTDLTRNFESSSMLAVAVLFQKFFGDYFFMEAGGGVFRPKVTLISEDNVKSNYSETNFGIVAGGGFYIPTSAYAGFMMKGKLHSYFDHYSKNYFGITGGVRFKIR